MQKFVLTETSAVWWPVTVRVPDPDLPGRMIEQSFEALLLPQDQDAYFETQEVLASIKDPRARATAERSALGQQVQSWRGVTDGAGAEIAYSAENLGLALRKAWFRTGIWQALGQINTGEEARLGN